MGHFETAGSIVAGFRHAPQAHASLGRRRQDQSPSWREAGKVLKAEIFPALHDALDRSTRRVQQPQLIAVVEESTCAVGAESKPLDIARAAAMGLEQLATAVFESPDFLHVVR